MIGSHPPNRRPLLRDDPVVPVYLIEIVVQMLIEKGVPEKDLLAGTKLKRQQIENHETLVTINEAQTLFQNFWRLGDDPALGVELGKRLHMSHLGTLGAALLSAPSLRQLLDALARYHSLAGPAWTIAWTLAGEDVRVIARRTIPLGNTGRLRTDAWFIALVRNLITLPHLTLEGGRLEFDYAAPVSARHLATYRQSALPFEVQFDRPEPAVTFKCPDVDMRLPAGSKSAFGEAVARCDQLLLQRRQQEDLPSMVMRMMQQAWPVPTLAQLAEDCCMSERTLERHLSEVGLSYRQVLDDYRKNRAIALVGETTVRLDDIAARLGYSDVSSFGKSFKRWTQKSPAAYRAGSIEE